MPLEHWVAAAAQEANKGHAKALGLSNCNADQVHMTCFYDNPTLLTALETPSSRTVSEKLSRSTQVRRACREAERHGQHIACNQIMFNLLCYGSPALQETEAVCRELGVAIIAYSPIGQGLLTRDLTQAKFDSIRVAKMAGISMNDLQPLRREVAGLADRHGKTMAQVCLNWAICHGAVPLVGCRSVEQARDSMGALGWRLAPEEVAGLDAVALSTSTLAKPRWRRGVFVVFISLLMLSYKASRVCEGAASALNCIFQGLAGWLIGTPSVAQKNRVRKGEHAKEE
jgi:aryl-alcohol dehydrogenase-like predicted oxidoreductase